MAVVVLPQARSARRWLRFTRWIAYILATLTGVYAAYVLFENLYYGHSCSASLLEICPSFGGKFVVPGTLLLFVLVDIIIIGRTRWITLLIDTRQFIKAKHRALFWAIIALIFGGFLVGLPLLVAWLRIRRLIAVMTGRVGMAEMAAVSAATVPMAVPAPAQPAPAAPPPAATPPPAAAPAPAPAPAPAAPTARPVAAPAAGAAVAATAVAATAATAPSGAGAADAAAAAQATPPPPPPPTPPAAPICPKCGQPTTYIEQYERFYCYTDKLYV